MHCRTRHASVSDQEEHTFQKISLVWGYPMSIVRIGVFCASSYIFIVLGMGVGNAQVNCALFRNPVDQARCAAANRAAAQAYWRERATTYSYYGGRVLDKGVGRAMGRVAPGGGAAYGAGGYVGPHLYNSWQNRDPNRRPTVLQPGYQMKYPYPFGPPRQFNYQRPRTCGYVGTRWVCS